MTWRQAADQYGITVEQLKEELPLEWVIEVAADVPLEEQTEGRGVGICPFHDDEDPSLDVYGYGTRWGCFPCGQGGDIFDFIGSFWSLDSFAARFEKAVQLHSSYKEEGSWTGFTKAEGPQAVVTDEMIQYKIDFAQKLFDGGTQYPLAQLLERKHLDIPPFWLREVWGVGVNDSYEVVAPYYNHAGDVISLKTRMPGRGCWYAHEGRTLSALYGEWMLGDEKNVWILEGETDTWLASYLLRGRGVALGLPRGAGAHVDDRWIELFRGRQVVICFDDDTAGHRAAERWYDVLRDVADEVRVTWPVGDLSESPNPRMILDTGKTVNTPTGLVTERADRQAYMQITRNGIGSQLTNWVIEPTKSLTYEGLSGTSIGYGFEGHFTNDRSTRRLITSRDLRNSTAAVDWSNSNERTFFGSGSKTTQGILDLLSERAPFLPSVVAHAMVGLHGVDEGLPIFVLPEELGGPIGSEIARERHIFYPTPEAPEFGERFRMEPDISPIPREEILAWAADLIPSLMALNRPDVVTPVIAWLCAAPLRSTLDRFPSMAVMGGSGSGKTTMLQAMLSAMFGVVGELNISEMTTSYGIVSWATHTNALPIWIDEYRAHVRKDTLQAVNQMLRDAWSGSGSSRGGVGDVKTKVHTYKITAPLLISGEGAFEERSHIDRILAITMPDADGGHKSETALQDLVQATRGAKGRLGRLYLRWLTLHLGQSTLPDVEPALDRAEHGMNVLRWGWKLFVWFCDEVLDLSIDPSGLDLSNVQRQHTSADEHPILAALADALEQTARTRDNPIPVAWIEQSTTDHGPSKIAVRHSAFHRWAVDSGYPLPGGQKATKNWLVERFAVPDTGGRVTYTDTLVKDKRVRGTYLLGVLEAIEELP